MDNTNDVSNGFDLTGLMNNLIGTAGDAYVANQQSQSSQAQAAAAAYAAYAQPGNPLAVLSSGSSRSWLIIGAGVLALALILRR